jgi:hypothetical protein
MDFLVGDHSTRQAAPAFVGSRQECDGRTESRLIASGRDRVDFTMLGAVGCLAATGSCHTIAAPSAYR